MPSLKDTVNASTVLHPTIIPTASVFSDTNGAEFSFKKELEGEFETGNADFSGDDIRPHPIFNIPPSTFDGVHRPVKISKRFFVRQKNPCQTKKRKKSQRQVDSDTTYSSSAVSDDDDADDDDDNNANVSKKDKLLTKPSFLSISQQGLNYSSIFNFLSDSSNDDDIRDRASSSSDSNESDLSDIDNILMGAHEMFRDGTNRQRLFGKKQKKKKKKERRLFQARKPKAKRKSAAKESEMSAEAEKLLEKANDAYIQKNIPEAVELLENVVRLAPGLHDPFHLLGLIYENELGNPRKALTFYLICAHLLRHDFNLWMHVANMSREQGKLKQAVQSYKRVLSSDGNLTSKESQAAAFELSDCYISLGDYAQAISRLEALRERYPNDWFLAQQVAKCYNRQNNFKEAIKVLKPYVKRLVDFETAVFESNDNGVPDSVTSLLQISSNLTKHQYVYGKYQHLEDGKKQRYMYDMDLTNMLAEVYLQAHHFQDCEQLLTDVVEICEESNVPTPIDLVAKLAASQLYNGTTSSECITAIWNHLKHEQAPEESVSDLYLLMAGAFVAANRPREALELYTAVASLPNVRSDASVWVKIARCELLLSGQTALGPAEMTKCIFEPDSVTRVSVVRNLKSDAKARMLLSKVITHVPRRYVSTLMRAITTDGTVEPQGLNTEPIEKLPDPIPLPQRKALLGDLQQELAIILPICAKCDKDVTNEEQQKRASWILRFLTLVEDFELDVRRVLAYTLARKLNRAEIINTNSQKQLLDELGVAFTEANDEKNIEAPEFLTALVPLSSRPNISMSPNMSSSPSNDISTPPPSSISNTKCLNAYEKTTTAEDSIDKRKSRSGKHSIAASRPSGAVPSSEFHVNFSRIKEKMGLKALEDILGWEDFIFFLQTGIGIIMKSAGMYRASVELIEAILANRRVLRLQTSVLERRAFQERLKRLSLQLSIDGGLYRIALSYMREKYLRHPDNSSRALQAYGRLLFSGSFSHATIAGLSSSVEREALLENRSWCIRQLLQRPTDFTLTLIIGHFCSLSGRWNLAVGEYIRAHRLVPQDDLTCLCLATAYLNWAASRTTQNRCATMLQGMAMISVYTEKRKQTQKFVVRTLEMLWQDSVFNKDSSSDHTEMTDDDMTEEGCLTDINKSKLRKAIEHCTTIVETVYEAETRYNLARACHHFNFVSLAVPLYLNVIMALKPLQTKDTFNAIDLVETTLHSKSLRTILMNDASQILLCAAHNLSLVHKSRGAIASARWASRQAIVWGD